MYEALLVLTTFIIAREALRTENGIGVAFVLDVSYAKYDLTHTRIVTKNLVSRIQSIVITPVLSANSYVTRTWGTENLQTVFAQGINNIH